MPGLAADPSWLRVQAAMANATSVTDHAQAALAAADLLKQHGAPDLAAQLLANVSNDLDQNLTQAQQNLGDVRVDPAQIQQQLSDLTNLQQQLAASQTALQVAPDAALQVPPAPVVVDPSTPLPTANPATDANAPADATQPAE